MKRFFLIDFKRTWLLIGLRTQLALALHQWRFEIVDRPEFLGTGLLFVASER